MDEEVEQAGEGHTNDRIHHPGVGVPVTVELVVQQSCDLERGGLEGVDLPVDVAGVDGVEVHLCEVAVEVLAEDLAAGV